MKILNSSYITCPPMGDVCPVFRRSFRAKDCVLSAELEITALGVYQAELKLQTVYCLHVGLVNAVRDISPESRLRDCRDPIARLVNQTYRHTAVTELEALGSEQYLVILLRLCVLRTAFPELSDTRVELPELLLQLVVKLHQNGRSSSSSA